MTPGTVVVITGGSAGADRGAALAFARKGCLVGVLARGVERLEATRREMEGLGVRCMPIPTDVAEADAWRMPPLRSRPPLAPSTSG